VRYSVHFDPILRFAVSIGDRLSISGSEPAYSMKMNRSFIYYSLQDRNGFIFFGWYWFHNEKWTHMHARITLVLYGWSVVA
jgi:hypothetical protein